MSKLFIIVPAIVTLLASPLSSALAAEPTQAELEARRREFLQNHISQVTALDRVTAVHASIRERQALHQAWLKQKHEDLIARHRRLLEWRKLRAENGN